MQLPQSLLYLILIVIKWAINRLDSLEYHLFLLSQEACSLIFEFLLFPISGTPELQNSRVLDFQALGIPELHSCRILKTDDQEI